MRIMPAVLLLVSVAWAVPDGGQEREVVAAKERLQAMLDEAALLEQAGRKEEAARVRAEAAELKRKIAGERDKADDAPREPLQDALHRLEQAIGALDRAGYEGMAGDLRQAADKLRVEIKRRAGDRERPRGEEPRGGEADFWRRNMDTLRIAMKALEEAEKHDAADIMERAIHAREVMIKGRTDEEAQQIMHKGPDDANLAEFLNMAAHCWREFKEPEKADRCEELGNFLRARLEDQQRARKEGARREGGADAGRREGPRPGPDDRMAQIEQRLDRMERMLQNALEEMQRRDRDRERGDR